MEKICYIIGPSDPEDLCIPQGREGLVIAADGGLAILESRGITADIVLGDFDSLGRVPGGENVLRYPVEKDDTDSMLAVKEGLQRGCRTFVLYGCLGGRMDHAYANYQALGWLAEHGARGYLLGGGWCAGTIRDGSISFPAGMSGTVSVFCPNGCAEGVSIRGLKYSLENGSLSSSFPLGVSNSFTGEKAEVSVSRGSLLLMWEESPEQLVNRL